MTCAELDRVITPFIDGECTEAERVAIVTHLRQCHNCRHRAEAESTVKHLLHAGAAVARTMGESVAWRPRVLFLGRPVLPVRPAWLVLLLAVAGAGLIGIWLRPTPLLAIGVIGDSYCNHEHIFTSRFNVDDHDCTLGCVERGAEFVLVTETEVYRIRNQQMADLVTFANHRVKVEGTVTGDEIVVRTVTAAERVGTPRPPR
jgi:hypothetical protein